MEQQTKGRTVDRRGVDSGTHTCKLWLNICFSVTAAIYDARCSTHGPFVFIQAHFQDKRWRQILTRVIIQKWAHKIHATICFSHADKLPFDPFLVWQRSWISVPPITLLKNIDCRSRTKKFINPWAEKWKFNEWMLLMAHADLFNRLSSTSFDGSISLNGAIQYNLRWIRLKFWNKCTHVSEWEQIQWNGFHSFIHQFAIYYSKAKSCALILSYHESHERRKKKKHKANETRSISHWLISYFNRSIETRVEEKKKSEKKLRRRRRQKQRNASLELTCICSYSKQSRHVTNFSPIHRNAALHTNLNERREEEEEKEEEKNVLTVLCMCQTKRQSQIVTRVPSIRQRAIEANKADRNFVSNKTNCTKIYINWRIKKLKRERIKARKKNGRTNWSNQNYTQRIVEWERKAMDESAWFGRSENWCAKNVLGSW